MKANSIPAEALLKPDFLAAFERDGYVIVENVFPDSLCNALIPELESAIDSETRKYHSRDHEDYGMLIACPVYGGHFLDVLNNPDFLDPFDWVLGETCTIWTYVSSSMPPHSGNWASRIHVDWPHFIPEFPIGVGSIILLEDFTPANGATWLLTGSHRSPDQPVEAAFFEQADRLVAPKGSVLYFNLRLWHAGGINRTSQWRHSLGIGMVRPYLKQKIDFPLALQQVDTSVLSGRARQKLGYYCRPPASLDEYYSNEKENARQRSEWE